MPENINPNGSLFGGVLMSWVDSVAYMSAQRHAEKTHVVTVNIDTIEFKEPIPLGAHVILTSRVEHVGNASMEIKVNVEKEIGESEDRITAASASLTFVALDENRRAIPVPRLKLETLEDYRRNLEAQVRIKVRKRLKEWLKKNTLKLLRESEILQQKSAVE